LKVDGIRSIVAGKFRENVLVRAMIAAVHIKREREREREREWEREREREKEGKREGCAMSTRGAWVE
jgi:hypothetical protein